MALFLGSVISDKIPINGFKFSASLRRFNELLQHYKFTLGKI
jgi:hypothetical protein